MLQYKVKFIELARYASLIMCDNEMKAKKFHRRLRPTSHTRMTTPRLRTFFKVVKTKRLVEKDCEELVKS